MVKKIEVWRKNIRWESGKKEGFLLPNLPITKIIIQGTETTDCTSTSTGENELSTIQMRMNNKVFINLQGDHHDAEPASILDMLEEFYKQKHHVSHPARQWVIEFPSPLPNAKIELILGMADYGQVACASDDAQPFDYTFDIIIEYDEGFKGIGVLPYITSEKRDTVAQSGHIFIYVPPMPKPLRAIILGTETGDAWSNSAYDRITIKTPEKIFFSGSFAELKSLQEGRSKFAQGTGFYIIQFTGGIKVDANTLLLDIEKTTGSNEELHLLYICY